MAWSSSDGSTIRYVLPVMWMTTRFHIMERMGWNKDVAYVSSSSSHGGTGAKSAVSVNILLWIGFNFAWTYKLCPFNSVCKYLFFLYSPVVAVLHYLQDVIRLEARLPPNIGFTLRDSLAVFTPLAITPPKMNRFGWNLEHSEYIFWADHGRLWARSAQ